MHVPMISHYMATDVNTGLFVENNCMATCCGNEASFLKVGGGGADLALSLTSNLPKF